MVQHVCAPALCHCDSVAEMAKSQESQHVSEAAMQRMQRAVEVLIRGCGEDCAREGLVDTPRRVAKAWLDLAGGLRDECHGAFGTALFHEPILRAGPDGIVLVRDITFAFLSERTLLPCHGRAHVAYVPAGGLILGLSKLARATKCLASRVQSQERFAADLLEAVAAAVQPAGAAVVVQATHLGGATGPEQRMASAACGCFATPGSPWMREVLTLLRLSPEDSTAAARLASAPGAADGGTQQEQQQQEQQQQQQQQANGAAPRVPGATAMVEAVSTLLECVGEDPQRQGLAGSAEAYVRWLHEATSGYRLPPAPPGVAPPTPGAGSTPGADLPSDAPSCEEAPAAERACCSNGAAGPAPTAAAAAAEAPGAAGAPLEVPEVVSTFCAGFSSQCEHHLLPFYGTLRVAYAGAACSPAVAAARLRHTVALYSRRLQVQERLSQQVAEAALAALDARSVLVACESAHMCMVARGVEKHASSTLTTAVRGRWAGCAAGRAAALERLVALAD